MIQRITLAREYSKLFGWLFFVLLLKSVVKKENPLNMQIVGLDCSFCFWFLKFVFHLIFFNVMVDFSGAFRLCSGKWNVSNSGTGMVAHSKLPAYQMGKMK